jgi:hypothetical protein
MPFYELIMLCKMGETQAMGTLIKNVSAVILQEGGIKYYLNAYWNDIGVVRGVENLGDRILCKNMKGKDGAKYGVGRYVAVINI